MKTLPKVLMYTDGGYSKHTNTSGYAVLLNTQGMSPSVIYGGAIGRTNNWAELVAMLIGLQQLIIPCNVTIVSDSMYSINCLDKWIKGWMKNNWITRAGSAVKNKELLEALYHYSSKHKIKLVHQRSHTDGNSKNVRGNDLVDHFATRGREEAYRLGYDFIMY